MHIRGLLALVALLGCAGFFAAPSLAAASPAPRTTAPPPRAPTLFVLRGPTRAGTGDLAVQSRSVEWFTDRPERRAGTMTPQALVHNWQAWGFAHDPPNAALTGNKLDVVVELSKPRVRNGQLHFHVKPVRGDLPHGDLGGVSAFVDATSPASTTSNVQIVNDSQVMTTAYVFVTANYSPQQMQSVAWLTTQVFPGSNSSLTWDNSTQLMASQGGALQPGALFQPQQTLSLPPAGAGQSGVAELTQQNGSTSLTADPSTGGVSPGSLGVFDAVQQYSPNLAVGLGLSGSPALVAAPYVNALTTFPANGLTYWLTTGFANPGQIIPSYQTSNAVRLAFPPGVSSLTATLEANGVWNVQPS